MATNETGKNIAAQLRGMAATMKEDFLQNLQAATYALADSLDAYYQGGEGEREIICSFDLGDGTTFDFTHIKDDGNIEGYVDGVVMVYSREVFLQAVADGSIQECADSIISALIQSGWSVNSAEGVVIFSHIDNDMSIYFFRASGGIRVFSPRDFLAGVDNGTIYGDYVEHIMSEIMHDELVTDTEVTEVYDDWGENLLDGVTLSDTTSLILDRSRPVLPVGEGATWDLLIPVITLDGSSRYYVRRADLDQAMFPDLPTEDDMTAFLEIGLIDHVDNLVGGGFDPLAEVNSPHDLTTFLDLGNENDPVTLRGYVADRYATDINDIMTATGCNREIAIDWLVFREQNRWNLDIYAISRHYARLDIELPAWVLKMLLSHESEMNPTALSRWGNPETTGTGLAQIEESGMGNLQLFNPASDPHTFFAFRTYTRGDIHGQNCLSYPRDSGEFEACVERVGRNSVDAGAAFLLWTQGVIRYGATSSDANLVGYNNLPVPADVLSNSDNGEVWGLLSRTERWEVTMAAYNAGAGEIGRAVRIYNDPEYSKPTPPTLTDILCWHMREGNEGNRLHDGLFPSYSDQDLKAVLVQQHAASIMGGRPTGRYGIDSLDDTVLDEDGTINLEATAVAQATEARERARFMREICGEE